MLITFILQSGAQDTLKPVKQDSLRTQELESPIHYSATDSIRFEMDNEHIYLFGEAVVEYEGVNLTAEVIEIDYKNNLVFAHGVMDSTGKLQGTPIFKGDGEEIQCEEITYDMGTGKGIIKNIVTRQGDLIIKGEKIKKDSNDVMFFKNLACIPCEFENSKTIFRATKAKVIPDDKIVTGPMYLEIAGVPTPVALPFGYFPNTKKRSKSGVIIPTYGESPNLGFFLKDGGFYLPMGPKMDMQIRGDIYSYGSWALKNFVNYNVRYKFTGAFNVGYSIFNTGEREIPFPNPNYFQRRQDFFVRWQHIQDPKARPGTRFSAVVNAGSNSFNQYNAQNTGQYLTNTFASNISYSKTFDIGSLNLNARHSQNTQTKTVEVILPEVTFNVNRFFPFRNEERSKQTWIDKIGMSYLGETKAILRRPDSLFFDASSTDLIQSGVHHNLPVNTNINLFKFVTFTPSMNLNAWNYFDYVNYTYDTTLNAAVADTIRDFKTAFDVNFSGSLTTKVFGNYLFRGKKIKQIRHTLIPAVSFTYRPDMTVPELDFYREVQSSATGQMREYTVFERGIYGYPSGARSGMLAFNLNNNVEAKVRTKTDTGYADKKIVLLQNLTVNGYYDFMAKERNMSNLDISGRTKIWKNIDLLMRGIFNPYAATSLGGDSTVYQYSVDGRLARFTSGNIAVNTVFSSQTFSSVKTNPQLTNPVENTASTAPNPNLPWTINVYYNLNYALVQKKETVNQTLNMSGDFFVTSKWRVGFTSGYDFVNKNISYTSLNIYRDLRCWEARFDWVPFGFRKRYSISINLKTSMLRDIKLPRTREWYDNL